MNSGLTCDELRPLLGGYVLEALEPHEAEAVRGHLPNCPACSAELASLVELPRLLDLAAPLHRPEEPLPPGFEEALLDRFARDRGTGERRRAPRFAWTRARVAVVTGVRAAAFGAGTVAVLQHDPAPRPARNYMLTLEATAARPGAHARIALYRVHGGTGVHLWARGLEPGPARVYEVLCGKRGWTASAGTFRADRDGRVEARLTTAARVGEYEWVRIVYHDATGHSKDVLTGRLF
jgi:hypothetical protein